MQPMSEADIVNATDSLRRQAASLNIQVLALVELAGVLDETDADHPFLGRLAGPLASLARCHAVNLGEIAVNLTQSVKHNEQVLASYRSQILLPNYNPNPRRN